MKYKLQYSLLNKFSVHGLTLLSNILLVRLLSPSDFGKIAMLSLIVLISQSLIDSGFSHAIIQAKKISKKELSTIFYINILIAITLISIIIGTSKLIEQFYNTPGLNRIANLLTIAIFFNALGLVQRSVLQRAIQTEKIFIIELIVVLISNSLAIILALNNFGVISLVMLIISRDLASTILFWTFSGWRPVLLFFKPKEIKHLISYGSNLLFVGFLNSIYKNISSLLIGRFDTVSNLGFYSKANNYSLSLPSITLLGFKEFYFSVFAKNQDNYEKLNIEFNNSINFLIKYFIPAHIFLILSINELVLLLFTEKWKYTAELFQILSIGTIFIPFTGIILSLLNSLGYSRKYLIADLKIKIFFIPLLIISYWFGLKIFAVTESLFFLINLIYFGYTLRKMTRNEIIFDWKIFKSQISTILVLTSSLIFLDLNKIHFNNHSLLIFKIFTSLTIFLISNKFFNRFKISSLGNKN